MKSISMKNSFSLERVIQLCKRYVAIKKNMILIGGLAIIGLILILYVGMVTYVPSSFKQNGIINVMSIAIAIVTYTGYAFTSTMFNEMSSIGSASQFLTLPATSFEKIMSALCVSYFCYTVVGMFALYIVNLILGVTSNFLFSMESFNKFLIYTIFQSIFLFGAAYFKANNFLSTAVAILASGVMLTLIIVSINYSNLSFNEWSLTQFLGIEKSDSIQILIKNLVLTVLATAFFIRMAFNRLKNRQIA